MVSWSPCRFDHKFLDLSMPEMAADLFKAVEPPMDPVKAHYNNTVITSHNPGKSKVGMEIQQ